MTEIEIQALPKEVIKKAKHLGNVLDDLHKATSKLETICKLVDSEWGYSVTDDMINLPSGDYKDFTQEQAQEMSKVIGQIYMIAHTLNCTSCDAKWKTKA